jgi:hypothetical protein
MRYNVKMKQRENAHSKYEVMHVHGDSNGKEPMKMPTKSSHKQTYKQTNK